MNKEYNLTISSSPHIRGADSTRTIMRDVLIALAPALLVSIYYFGPRALLLTAVSIAACVFFEWGYRKVMKKPQAIGDLSAVVTGTLLAFVCPVTTPYWTIIIGAFFAIVIVKQLYGGIGKNFMNPALAARAFMFSWPAIMTTWAKPGTWPGVISAADAVTSATPLAEMKYGSLPGAALFDSFIGNVGGCVGEVSTLLLILGGAYLVLRGVISLRIPLSFLLTVAVLTFLIPQGNDRLIWMANQLCSGGLMLGAIFMATDYCTSPVTKTGQIIFGIGCGALTVFIRYLGSYPEGVSYAILIMNAFVWLFDKIGRPRRFGVPGFAKAGDSK